MKPLKTLGIALAVTSIIGLGASWWMFSNDATVTSNFIFQVLLGGSLAVFVSGIGLIFLSRNKADPFKAAKEVLLDEPGENSPEAGKVEKTLSTGVRPTAPPATGISNPELSFEEEMALRKKRYFGESMGTVEPVGVGRPASAQPDLGAKSKPGSIIPPGATAVHPKPPQEKIKIKLEWPFKPKKKPDSMRDLLDVEEKKAERQPQFKFD